MKETWQIRTMAAIALGMLALSVSSTAQPPAAQPQPADGGRGGAAARGGGRGGAGGARGRRGGFTQYTRPLAPQDILVRGKALYDTNCASCHAEDMRGNPPKGTNLLRAASIHNDKAGETFGPAVAKHSPALSVVQSDLLAIRDYLHSVLATMSGQGSPPGRNTSTMPLNILVGDAKAGEAYTARNCTSCHSLDGFFKGIATRYPDPRTLQNVWVGGGGGGAGGGGGGRGGGSAGNKATVTLANGQKLEGTLVRKDEFIVILNLPGGARKSFARNNGIPKVEVEDPQAAHKKMVLALDDPENKNMHDVTAYLATLK